MSRLFYLETIPQTGHSAMLDKRDHQHLFRTLRARPGDEVTLLDGRGTVAEAIVTADSNLQIRVRETSAEPRVKISLAVAVPRRQKMDQLLKQCTEIGVWQIIPLIAERSVAIPEKEEKDERWQTLLIESCKQSRNPFMPYVGATIRLKDFLQSLTLETPAFFGEPGADCVLSAPISSETSYVWWIVGPEGGFSEKEVELLKSSGVHPISLSPYILRVETAAVLGAGWLAEKFMGKS